MPVKDSEPQPSASDKADEAPIIGSVFGDGQARIRFRSADAALPIENFMQPTRRTKMEYDVSDELEAYVKARRDAARKIKPKTAKLSWQWAWSIDPYCVEELPFHLANLELFAMSPEWPIWVWVGDLPTVNKKALLEIYERELLRPPKPGPIKRPRTPVNHSVQST